MLYGLSYTMKSGRMKDGEGPNYNILPLEGQWRADDNPDFTNMKKVNWCWNLGIIVPDFIKQKDVEFYGAQLREKKNPPALNKIKLEKITDGLSVRILHIAIFIHPITLRYRMNEYR